MTTEILQLLVIGVSCGSVVWQVGSIAKRIERLDEYHQQVTRLLSEHSAHLAKLEERTGGNSASVVPVVASKGRG